MDLRELLVRKFGRDVHTLNLRADHRRQRADMNRFVGLATGAHQRFDSFQGLGVHGVFSDARLLSVPA
jgi:hypothetical protein